MKVRFKTPFVIFISLGFLFVAGWQLDELFAFKTKKSSHQKLSNHDAQTIPNKIVIKFKEGRTFGKTAFATGLATFDQLLRIQKITQLQQVYRPRHVLAKIKSSRSLASLYYAYFTGSQPPQAVAQALRQHPAVEYAEPLYRHRLTATPNDTLFSQQTFYAVIQAEQAWNVVKGEQGSVVVAIVDGGTDIDHSDLAANIWRNAKEIAGNGIDDDDNGFVDDVQGWNFANNSNDPSGLDATPQSANHGSHSAGLVGAVSNNVTGVAGTSWNAKIMPINASNAVQDLVVDFGYEGILYAADNGADVINLSWSRLGSPSAFEQDIINLTAASGAAIIAAAGNDGRLASALPASYKNVLSVAMTNNSDLKDFNSNYGTDVDISAPGRFIFSTLHNGRYGSFSGTSFSTPIVSGVAALVKTQHPNWSGNQVAEQVRVTADNIDQLNPNFAGLLGKGRVNALQAVTQNSPSVRITDLQFSDSDDDGVIEPGETVEVTLKLKNYLTSVSNLNLTLTENDNFVNVTNPTQIISAINSNNEITLSTPFIFTVASGAPGGRQVVFNLELTAGKYQDLDHFTLTILPIFKNIEVNNIGVTITNVGRIGFADPDNSTDSGMGFTFKNGGNLLYEGAIIAGASQSQISNAARSRTNSDDDFAIVDGGDLQLIIPGTRTDHESIGIFNDSKATLPMNIRIKQETFAMTAPPNDDFIFFRFTIENSGLNVLNNFHFGIFFDWDIDEKNYATNVADYDHARKLGYAFGTSGNAPGTYVGMSVLSDGGVSYRAIDNGASFFGTDDGFTDNEKWQTISGGVQVTRMGPADIAFVIGAGPYSLPADQSVEIGFALLAGENLSDLQANADTARALWNKLFPTAVEEPTPVHPVRFYLNQNYPNPFNPATTIRYEIARDRHVQLVIYNLRGQKIRTLVDEKKIAGAHTIQWSGNNDAGTAVASGMYILLFQAGEFVQSRKLLLLK
ncbi:MAG: S8 family serine peptidase [bacterium]